MKDNISKYMSKVYTGQYLSHIKHKDINLMCYMHLDSKAFGDTTKSFLINRWSTMTDIDIINDLMSVNNNEIYNHPFPYNRKYSSIFWIISYNCIEIVPLNIIKQLPGSLWNEQILDTHGSTDMTKYEVITIREYLLRKRKTPSEVKEYLK